jgi:outer membrane protein TolC
LRVTFFAAVITFVLLAWTGIVGTSRSQDLPIHRIAILADGPWVLNDSIRGLFMEEILDIAEGEFDIRFPPEATLVGDWSLESVREHLDRLLVDPSVDIIITLGVLSSQAAAQRGAPPKPVIAPIVVDAHIQGLPDKNGTSGVENFNYLVFPNNIRRDIETFLEIVPFTQLAIFFSRRITDGIPELPRRTRTALATIGVEPTIVSVDMSVDEALDQLSPDAEAVYVAPLLHLPNAEYTRLVSEINRRKLPSFSLFGVYGVERGLLASVNAEIFSRLSRRVALNVQRVLLGENAGALPTAFRSAEKLTINMATARAIGVYPSWAVLTDAVLINDVREDVHRVISIESAVTEALDRNLMLAAKDQSVAAAEEDIALARSELLPQIDLSLLGLQVDEERASRSAGQQAEQTVSGAATLNQILYAEPAWANLSIQKHLQSTREYDRDAFKLDIAQQAATAYLNVLRAKTFERIQKENLRRTRSNLELAQVRQSIGTAGPAEVYRWRSELADNKKTVIDANADRNLAEIELNRLLNRPEEEPFLTGEVDLDDPNLLLSRGRLLEYMNNPWDFKVLRSFMVKEGIESTPEIRVFEEAIAAEERAAKSAGRSFWMPSFSLFADVAYVFAREGAGADVDEGAIPPELLPLFGAPEDLSWSLGLSANYAIEGGAKIARRQQSLKNLADLRIQLASTMEIVEQRIRSAMHTTGASHAGIEQSRLSADAAEQTLVLVEDSYARGAATILDLLDAQNNSLIADLKAANAIYSFLIDLMETERSIGRLVLQMSDAEREAFCDRMDDYFSQAGRAR